MGPCYRENGTIHFRGLDLRLFGSKIHFRRVIGKGTFISIKRRLRKTTVKILFADDEKALVDTITKRLKKRGIDTIPAFNGKEALDRIKENSTIEAVVFDIKMPVIDGMSALKVIKK